MNLLSHRVLLNVSFIIILTFFFTLDLPPIGSHFKSIKTHKPLSPHAFIDYLNLFYCLSTIHPSLAYTLLALWLILLFYLLGNTASHYFCSSLEGLSHTLRLPPSLAGVTLLALGNGAPDVFSSLVSARDGAGEVGLNSILGGAFFVSTVVVGIISICITPRSVIIHRASFVRDILFFIAILCILLLILISGKITILGSVSFASLYIVYVLIASVGQCCRQDEIKDLEAPLLDSVPVTSPKLDTNWLLCLLEMPLYLPRRLTIPDIVTERWSKPFAVASAIFSPILIATLWVTGSDSNDKMVIYGCSVLVGILLGIAAEKTTVQSHPPQRFVFPWLAGGFLMSVVWTYITARELVALLVASGHILNISPEVLGLTVLAWGNSLGDLVANVAMAVEEGRDGAQIAVSGCYAGPIFNTLGGLGVSLVVLAVAAGPGPLVIMGDRGVYETLGFLIGGLVWALVVVLKRGMKVDRVMGIGLLGIYMCFLCLRLGEYTGLVWQVGVVVKPWFGSG